MNSSISSRHDPDLEILRTHKLESGYHGVYAHKSNGWRVKAFRARGCGADFKTPELAARAVIAEWRSMYGDEWPHYFRARFWHGWLVYRTHPTHGDTFRVWTGEGTAMAEVGYRPVVWVFGEKQILWPKRGVAFASPSLAKKHVRHWISQQFGMFDWWAVRRKA